MSTHNVFDNNQCGCGSINDPIVDKLLGNAYQVVKYVAMNMPAIKSVSDELASILAVFAKLKELNDVALKLPELLEVQAELPKLEVLHSNLNQLITLYTHIDELVKVSTGIDDIKTIIPHLQEIGIVAANIADVISVGKNITKVVAVANNIVAINKLAPLTTEIDVLADNIQALANINTHMSELLNINHHLPDLLNIETPLSKLVINSFEALRRTYAEVGLNLVQGSFEEGVTLTDSQDVLLQRSTGKCFNWQAALPDGGKVIPTGSTPESTGGIGIGKWQDVTNTTQHSQAQYSDGVDYKTYYAWQDDVTLQHKDEAVQFKHGGMFYRWGGVFPQTGIVIPKNTIEPTSNQIGHGKYVAVVDLAVRDLCERSAGYLTIEQFGAVRGDSSRSYAPEIQAALNASAQTGKTIRDSGAYYIKGVDTLVIPKGLSIDSQNLVFNFSERDRCADSLSLSFNGISGPLMCGSGSAGEPLSLPRAVKGEREISASGVSVGDMLLIYSDDVREGDNPPQQIGEINFAVGVVGSAVTLETKLADNYTTNPKLRVINPIDNVNIRGLKLIGKGRQDSGRGDLGLFLLFGKDVNVDVDIDDVDQVGVDLIACKNWSIRGSAVTLQNGSNNDIQYQYRYSSGSCDGVIDVTGRGGRCVSIGGSYPEIPGVNRNVRIEGSASGVWLTGFSMHQSDDGTSFDVVADSCDNVIRMKTSGCNITSLIARQCRIGALLYRAASDCTIASAVGYDCDAVVLVTNADAVAGVNSLSGIEIDDINSFDCQAAINITGTFTESPIDVAAGRITSVRSSATGGLGAVTATGASNLSVGHAKIIGSSNYDVRASSGAKIFIDTLEVSGKTSTASILSADGVGSRVTVGRLIIRGSTTAAIKLESNGGVVTVFQIVDLR